MWETPRLLSCFHSSLSKRRSKTITSSAIPELRHQHSCEPHTTTCTALVQHYFKPCFKSAHLLHPCTSSSRSLCLLAGELRQACGLLDILIQIHSTKWCTRRRISSVGLLRTKFRQIFQYKSFLRSALSLVKYFRACWNHVETMSKNVEIFRCSSVTHEIRRTFNMSNPIN